MRISPNGHNPSWIDSLVALSHWIDFFTHTINTTQLLQCWDFLHRNKVVTEWEREKNHRFFVCFPLWTPPPWRDIKNPVNQILTGDIVSLPNGKDIFPKDYRSLSLSLLSFSLCCSLFQVLSVYTKRGPRIVFCFGPTIFYRQVA